MSCHAVSSCEAYAIRMDTFCGTTGMLSCWSVALAPLISPGYASPEMLACRKYLGEETDVWSLGIILYILLCGGLPFDDDDDHVMKDLIIKGDYEEPEWLSEGMFRRCRVHHPSDAIAEARSLIRGMLHHEPAQRLTIPAILTHSWFKMPIIDRAPSQSVPASPNPGTSGAPGPFFTEPFYHGDPGPGSTASSSRFLSPLPPMESPLTQQTVNAPSQPDSEPSETSFEFGDSERGRADSGVTTPTTAEGDDEDPIKRTHSGEFSYTEKALELLHTNSSQSTIRRDGTESPGTVAGSVKNKVAMRPPLEGQREVDEDAVADGEALHSGSASLPILDDQSLHLPVALHSRTPSRTKRRSVSSTLSLERKQSHHSTSGQWQTFQAEDYLAQLNLVQPELFSTSSEKALLGQLSDLGIDTGQLMHSVQLDACDSSAGIWWILRQKQAERGETDEVINARNASAARRRERAAAYQREERRKARSSENSRDPSPVERHSNVHFGETTSIPVTPSFSVIDLGPPVAATSRPMVASPSNLSTSLPRSNSDMSLGDNGKLAVPETKSATRPVQPFVETQMRLPPHTPPRERENAVGRPDLLSSPSESSPVRDRTGKTRSPSMSAILQRATSVFAGRKVEEKEQEKDKVVSPPVEGEVKEAKERDRPTKLTNPPPKAKIFTSENDNTLLSVPRSSPPSTAGQLTPSSSLRSADGGLLSSASMVPDTSGSHGSVTSTGDIGGKKLAKKESLWNTFRHLFIEDRRRIKRELDNSPLSGEVTVVTPTVVLSRGIAARTPHATRINQPTSASRRTSLDNARPVYSRRSSSVNSRRSSVTSMHHEVPEIPLGRRASQKSHGSQTPTSDREYSSSRPESAVSYHKGPSGKQSSVSMKSPSFSDPARFRGSTPSSPLHNYQRRAPSGSASTRVRHIRVIPETQILRPSSVASSIKSNASSRASSRERGNRDRDGDQTQDSDYDSRDEVSFRTKRRKGDEKSSGSLAHQIHRTRSPLAKSDSGTRPPKQALGLSKSKKPLRDVFQKGDEEWVDEDEDRSGFAGGLGQSASAFSATAGSNVIWKGRAATHPSTLTPVTRGRTGGGKKPTVPHGLRGRRRSSSDEEDGGKNVKGKEAVRRVVPDIEEEEEEEE